MLVLQGTERREVKQLGLGRTARRRQSRDRDPGGLALQLTFLSRTKNWTQVLPEACCVTQGSSSWFLSLELGTRSPDAA